jgi:hypothetical protein
MAVELSCSSRCRDVLDLLLLLLLLWIHDTPFVPF